MIDTLDKFCFGYSGGFLVVMGLHNSNYLGVTIGLYMVGKLAYEVVSMYQDNS